jgi:hypothetical protein
MSSFVFLRAWRFCKDASGEFQVLLLPTSRSKYIIDCNALNLLTIGAKPSYEVLHKLWILFRGAKVADLVRQLFLKLDKVLFAHGNHLVHVRDAQT